MPAVTETDSAERDRAGTAEGSTKNELRSRLTRRQDEQQRRQSMQVPHEGPSFAAEWEWRKGERDDHKEIIG
jgi:hypothetical protein